MTDETLASFSAEAKSIKIGSIYEHYKGGRYKVLEIARHSETLEELVVYRPLFGKGDVWVRPLTMFLEKITVSGVLRPRFKLTK